MQAEPLGKLLPRLLLPYLQQWAERSGMTLLQRLLVDEHFRGVVETYGDEILTRMMQATAPGNGNGRSSEGTPASPSEPRAGDTDGSAIDLTNLQDRVMAMEAQQEAQQVLFESLRTKIRPLALALGSCPECLVGIDGCPKCSGRSRVAHYPPDYPLLEAHVVNPLAARGVPLVLKERTSSNGDRHTGASTTKRRSTPWPKR